MSFRANRSTAEKNMLLQTITTQHLEEVLSMDPNHLKKTNEDPYESIMPLIYDLLPLPRVLSKDPSMKPWAAGTDPSTPPFKKDDQTRSHPNILGRFRPEALDSFKHDKMRSASRVYLKDMVVDKSADPLS